MGDLRLVPCSLDEKVLEQFAVERQLLELEERVLSLEIENTSLKSKYVTACTELAKFSVENQQLNEQLALTNDQLAAVVNELKLNSAVIANNLAYLEKCSGRRSCLQEVVTELNGLCASTNEEIAGLTQQVLVARDSHQRCVDENVAIKENVTAPQQRTNQRDTQLAIMNESVFKLRSDYDKIVRELSDYRAEVERVMAMKFEQLHITGDNTACSGDRPSSCPSLDATHGDSESDTPKCDTPPPRLVRRNALKKRVRRMRN